MLGERMEDASRDDDELPPTAAAREADRVVVQAQMRVAGATPWAAHAADVPLAHDALARLDGASALADRVDDALHSWPGTTGKRTQRGSRAPVAMSRSVLQTPATTLEREPRPVPASVSRCP